MEVLWCQASGDLVTRIACSSLVLNGEELAGGQKEVGTDLVCLANFF